jgi:hypothetical protein
MSSDPSDAFPKGKQSLWRRSGSQETYTCRRVSLVGTRGVQQDEVSVVVAGRDLGLSVHTGS